MALRKMNRLFLTALFVLTQFSVNMAVAQQAAPDSAIIKLIDEINHQIDRSVVAKDMKFLSKHYGEDFVFTHGTGLIDSKNSWLESIRKSKGYASREHDSTVVELHDDIAIISGKLTVGRLTPPATAHPIQPSIRSCICTSQKELGNDFSPNYIGVAS